MADCGRGYLEVRLEIHSWIGTAKTSLYRATAKKTGSEISTSLCSVVYSVAATVVRTARGREKADRAAGKN